jgi:hypothetical protein
MKRIEPEQNQSTLPILCKGSRQQRKRLSLYACHLSQLSLIIVPPPGGEQPVLSEVYGHARCGVNIKLPLTKRPLSPFCGADNLILWTSNRLTLCATDST